MPLENDPVAFVPFVQENPEGSRVTGRVISAASYGVICELGPGVEALLPVPGFTEAKIRPHRFPDDYPKVGESIEAYIAYINHEHRKIRLSQRADLS